MNLISIVVPVFNVEKYLNECLDSIVYQTYNNLEIILVDDGSTDNSGEICDSYGIRDKRIKVIHKQNGGLSDARNVGIKIAKGKYITFVDSDDEIAKDMIEYLYIMLKRSNADIAVCQRSLIDEDGKAILTQTEKKCKDIIIQGYEECMKAYLKTSDIDTVAWGKLYKTSLFEDVSYPKGRYHEDVFTTYKLVAKSKTIAIGYEKKYLYRIRQGSITQIAFSKKHMDAITGKEKQAEFIKKKFPSLYPLAQGDIIYACNQCLLKLAKSETSYEPFIDDFKMRYNKYTKFYISGNYRLIGKVFALASRINLVSVIRIVRIVNYIKKNL